MHTAVQEWVEFVGQIYPYAPVLANANRIRTMHNRLTDHLREDEARLAGAQGVYRETHLQDQRQVTLLLQELEQHMRSSRTAAPLDLDTDRLDAFFKQVQETYDVLLWSFFSPLSAYEERINSYWSKLPQYREARAQDVKLIGDLYDRFNADVPKVRLRYETLKREMKRDLPARMHRMLDWMVTLFVYEPYETGLLYIRRNLPGTIGAFHGLPTPVGFNRPLK